MRIVPIILKISMITNQTAIRLIYNRVSLKIVLFQVILWLVSTVSVFAQVVTGVQSGASTLDFTVNSGQPGNLYYVLYNAVPGSPTPASIKADATAAVSGSIVRNGTLTVGSAEIGTTLTRLLTNLTDNRTYYLYAVFEAIPGGLGTIQNFTRVLPLRQPALSYTATAASISGKTINYLLYKTEPYYKNPAKSYPLLLFFHGDGEKAPASINAVKNNGPPKIINQGGELDFIVASPQSQGVGVVDWLSPGFLDEFLEKLKTDNRVDISKVYVTALSGGGGGLYYLGATQPAKIAAQVPVSGANGFWVFGTDKYCNIKDIPLWGFHNLYDGTVTVNNLNAVVNAINGCTPPPVVAPITTIYNAYGHDAWTQTYDNPAVYTWLLGKTKPDPTNPQPTVNAGADVSVGLPANSVTLTGTAADPGGSIALYEWRKLSGPDATIGVPNGSSLKVKDLQAGTYAFRLTVTDNKNSVNYDDVVVNVSGNQPPVVNAGGNKSVSLPAFAIAINGSATDADGTVVSYLWTQQSGTPLTLTNANTPSLTAGNLVSGTFVFRLTATDNLGATGYSEMTLTVNAPPVANAGGNKVITLPVNFTTLSGSGTDADGTIASYSWTQQSGPNTATLGGAGSATLSASGLVAGTYTFRLTVTDNLGATAFADASVTVSLAVANIPPVANAGANQAITLPTNALTLNGSGTDADGTIVGYAWSQRSGPAGAILTGTATATLSLANLSAGTYVFRLTVTDNQAAIAFADVTVTVNTAPVNVPPVANAGGNKTITLPISTIVLNGTATDSDGSITSVLWTQTAGPNTATLSGNTTNSLTASNLIAGTYKFRLTATDNQAATGSDEMTLTVNPAPVNLPPTANAGGNKAITLPTSTIVLNGTASDPDGTIASVLWTQTAGAGTVTLSGTTTNTLTLTGLTAGTYKFRLTATDNQAATGFDEMTLTVNPAPVNNPPVGNAGGNKTITLPVSTFALTGSATDSDGFVAFVDWTQQTGPNTATLSGNTTNNLTVSNLIAGTYKFRFTATDNLGATGFDEMTLTVNPQPPNILPIVNAGADITLTSPASTSTLTAVATDADGTISSYSWTQITGPNTATLSGSATASLSVSGLIAGTYTFRITVTDNRGGTAIDEVNITVVLPAVNKPPVVSGGGNKTLQLPTNTLTLTGTATDPDGTVQTVAWTQQSGGAATLGTTNTLTLNLSNLVAGTYVFRLTATDDQGATGYDEVTLVVDPAPVNIPPVANAGGNQSVTLPTSTIILNGTASDSDGSVASVAWTQQAGPNTATLSGNTSNNLTVSNLIAGTYKFRFNATDNQGASGFDEMTLTINPKPVNLPPTANAGGNQSITLPVNTLVLNGSGSDPESGIITFFWEQTLGTAATLSGIGKDLTVSDLTAGTYKFKLTVTDDNGNKGTDEMTLIVYAAPVNNPPVANAGPDKAVTLPVSTVVLTGTASDSDGSIASVLWTQISGPNTATLSGNMTNTLTATNLIAGTYLFRFTATDNQGATGQDEMTLTVNPLPANMPPVANAGGNQSVTLPVSSFILNGIASDPDGSIVSIAWTQQSGPNTAVLSGNTTNSLTLSKLIAGTYVFRLTATDNQGATAFDEMTLAVNAAAGNLPPVAGAGGNKSITLPLNAVSLSGIATDPDGSVASVLWTQTAGSTASFTGETTSYLNLTGLTAGTYTFQFTITDDKGATASDVATVTVNPAVVNQPPVVSTSKDTTLLLPVSVFKLYGTASDPDGSINTYSWAKQSGPFATLTGAETSVLTLSDLIAGTYVFRLTVTDNQGAAAFADVKITVKPNLTNYLPVASAGNDTTLLLPVNSYTLYGQATNNGGQVVFYEWTQQTQLPAQLLNPNTPTLTVANLQAGIYIFRLTVTNNSGGQNYDEVTVVVLSQIPVTDLRAKKIFSPNNDAIDDYWEIEKISQFPSYKVLIINENGKIVFTSQVPYQTDVVWDGRANGADMPEGAYYFVVKSEDKDILAGSFVLIR